MIMRYVRYRCTECNAEDTDKLFPGEQPVPAINCWNCHAGMKYKNTVEQAMAQVGMLMLPEEEQPKGRRKAA